MFQKNISKQYYLKKLFLYFQVSWLRGSDLQVLSSGWDKFTSDNRIRIFPADQSHSWTLSITNVTTKDTGAYLCQVNTEPKLTLRYILTVEGNFQSQSRKKYTYAIIMRLNCEDIKNMCIFFSDSDSNPVCFVSQFFTQNFARTEYYQLKLNGTQSIAL